MQRFQEIILLLKYPAIVVRWLLCLISSRWPLYFTQMKKQVRREMPYPWSLEFIILFPLKNYFHVTINIWHTFILSFVYASRRYWQYIMYWKESCSQESCTLAGRHGGAMSQRLGWQPPHGFQLELFWSVMWLVVLLFLFIPFLLGI